MRIEKGQKCLSYRLSISVRFLSRTSLKQILKSFSAKLSVKFSAHKESKKPKVAHFGKKMTIYTAKQLTLKPTYNAFFILRWLFFLKRPIKMLNRTILNVRFQPKQFKPTHKLPNWCYSKKHVLIWPFSFFDLHRCPNPSFVKSIYVLRIFY